jgi:IS5 family transposase
METYKLSARYAKLDRQGDPLLALNEAIPWERFRPTLQKALKKLKKTEAGRKPYDYVMMFKLLVLQTLYNLNVDVKYKLIRKYVVTAASQGDINCMDLLLDENNRDKDIWGDKAYRSAAVEAMLRSKGYTSRIHFKGGKGGWISEDEERWNRRYSKIRARVEHVFVFITNSMKGNFIRTIRTSSCRIQNRHE